MKLRCVFFVLLLCAAVTCAHARQDMQRTFILNTLQRVYSLIEKEFVYAVEGSRIVQGALGEMQKVDRTIVPSSCRSWEAFESSFSAACDRNPSQASRLGEAAIKGMVKSLGDPYSLFLDAKEWSFYRRAMNGESFAGIGVELAVKNNRLVITTPLKGCPAEKAGIRPGDIVLKVNGVSIEGRDLYDVINSFDGERGSTIGLTVKRKTGATESFTIMRDNIRFDPVSAKILGSQVGYMAISYFGPDTEKEARKAIDAFGARSIRRLIIDVRNNPGGDFQASLKIAGFLEDRGALLIRKVKRSGAPEEIRNEGQARGNFTIAVLINEGSASAAEVLAASLCDNRKALLVGTRSFGKGLVQSLYSLPGETALKLSTSRYLTPKGSDIHTKGLVPEIIVETKYPMGSLADDPVVLKALEMLRRKD